MTAAKKIVIILVCLVSVLLVGISIYGMLLRRSLDKAAIWSSSGVLVALADHWRKDGEPQGEALEKLLASYGTFKPFVYTNAVNITGTNFVCLFGIERARFAEPGKLVITRDGTIIWIGEKGARIILVNR
jgi:hypothetical protein